jgi:hypothetical protein
VRSINNFTEVIFRNQFFKNHVDSTFTKSVIDLIGHHFITDQLIGIIVGNATAKVVAGGSGVLCGSKIAITLKILTIIILFL